MIAQAATRSPMRVMVLQARCCGRAALLRKLGQLLLPSIVLQVGSPALSGGSAGVPAHCLQLGGQGEAGQTKSLVLSLKSTTQDCRTRVYCSGAKHLTPSRREPVNCSLRCLCVAAGYRNGRTRTACAFLHHDLCEDSQGYSARH